MNSFGTAVRKARLSAGLSQRQLAELLGVGRTAICQLESGKHGLSEANLRRVAKALGITPSDVLRFGEEASDA